MKLLPRVDHRKWLGLQLTANDKHRSDDYSQDVLDSFKQIPLRELNYTHFYDRVLEDMAAINPNWETLIGKPVGELGTKGQAMFKRLHYKWKKYLEWRAPKIDEASPEA